MAQVAPERTQGTDELLREYLSGRDVDCPQCGYNLRDLPGNICPECGEKLTLGVRMIEPRQGALLAGLIGLSSGAGLSGLLLVYGLIRIGQEWNLFMGINAAGLIALGALLFLWLRYWRWIQARPIWARLMLVSACWLASLADLVVFTIYIR